MEAIITLFHPLNAPAGQDFPDSQAKAMLAMSNNGGWYSKDSSQKAQDVKSSGTQGKAEIPTEKKPDQKGG